MEKYLKLIRKLQPEKRKLIIDLWQKILVNDLKDVSFKKLQGFEDLYSIRKGKIRLVFKKTSQGNLLIDINCRSKVYKNL